MLIVLGGLPATGKTTLARLLAGKIRATHLRIDTIEQALRDAGIDDVGEAGYRVAYALAEDMLRLGQVVIADSVNPLTVTRAAWRAVAVRAAVPVVEVEIVRSDPADHRRHVEARVADIDGLALPSWTDVVAREYERWDEPHVIVDTSGRTADQSVTEVLGALQCY